MKLSPFTPIYFADGGTDKMTSRYVQTWSTADTIMIQVVADASESAPSATLNDARTGGMVSTIPWQTWNINEDKVIYFATLHGLLEGYYTITIADRTSEPMCVTTDVHKLAKTTLVKYRFKDNKQREDVVSIIDGDPYFFEFRIPGGFKDSGWSFGVSNEQFNTQNEDVVELYAHDYVIKQFTMGGSIGVPVWYGEMLNRLLTCSYVYFDGKRYARNESETPQVNVLIEGLESFVYTQSLREIKFLEPNLDINAQST